MLWAIIKHPITFDEAMKLRPIHCTNTMIVVLLPLEKDLYMNIYLCREKLLLISNASVVLKATNLVV